MDRRDEMHRYGGLPNGAKFDSNRMKIIVTFNEEEEDEETVEFSCKMEVCGTCHGTGSHVNPSIDSHGISSDEFAEDPDFAEDYFSGTYDVTCYECNGEKVTPTVDESQIKSEETKAQLEKWYDHLQSEAEYRAESEHERRMGY